MRLFLPVSSDEALGLLVVEHAGREGLVGRGRGIAVLLPVRLGGDRRRQDALGLPLLGLRRVGLGGLGRGARMRRGRSGLLREKAGAQFNRQLSKI